MGVGGTRSSVISPPYVRFSGNSSSVTVEQSHEKGEDQQDGKKGEKTEDEWMADNDLVKSDYWGVTTKKFHRKDGTKWWWNDFMAPYGCRAMMLEIVVAEKDFSSSLISTVNRQD